MKTLKRFCFPACRQAGLALAERWQIVFKIKCQSILILKSNRAFASGYFIRLRGLRRTGITVITFIVRNPMVETTTTKAILHNAIYDFYF
ncbi:hypothetical protein [Spongiimicrobium sp. 2-473A-2-J]|uniref:hypothetical protein n=1 Tax=Eudoraea algarum TaxID=3417568 RepID=UPI003D35FD4D